MVNLSRRGALVGIGAVGIATIAGGGTARAAEGDIQANKAIVARLFDEVYNGGAFDVLDELLTPDFISDDPAAAPGIDAYKQEQVSLRAQYEQLFSSYSFEMADLAAEADFVFARVLFTAKQIDITKPDVSALAFIEFTFKGGKVAQVWSLVDVDALRTQLG